MVWSGGTRPPSWDPRPSSPPMARSSRYPFTSSRTGPAWSTHSPLRWHTITRCSCGGSGFRTKAHGPFTLGAWNSSESGSHRSHTAPEPTHQEPSPDGFKGRSGPMKKAANSASFQTAGSPGISTAPTASSRNQNRPASGSSMNRWSSTPARRGPASVTTSPAKCSVYSGTAVAICSAS